MRPHLRGEVGVGVLRGVGVELLDDGGAAVAEGGVVDAAVGALADEGAVAEVVGDLLELVEGDGGHVDAHGLGGAADPGRARSPRPTSVACMRHAWIEMRRHAAQQWWSDDIDGDLMMPCMQLYRTGGIGIGWRNRLVGRRAVAVLLGATAARHL